MEGTSPETKVPSALNKKPKDSEERASKKEKIHVTWDEEQLAEHDKTRGNKMKIDEPKTPYVTEEEFKKLCDEDPDYQKEFGNKDAVGSEEAVNDRSSEDERMLDEGIELA